MSAGDATKPLLVVSTAVSALVLDGVSPSGLLSVSDLDLKETPSYIDFSQQICYANNNRR